MQHLAQDKIDATSIGFQQDEAMASCTGRHAQTNVWQLITRRWCKASVSNHFCQRTLVQTHSQPAQRTAGTSAGGVRAVRPKANGKVLTTQKKIVAVIEDDPSMRASVVRLLSALGYATEAFDSAEAFLNVAEKNEAACLVIDVHLGDM